MKTHLTSSRQRGFTLIEILVAISIIIILAGIMVAVAGSVQKNARINETRATLKAIEGMIEKYEAETNTRLVGTTGTPAIVGTLYADNNGLVVQNPTVADFDYVAVLSRHPATKGTIASLGSKVRTNGTFSYIVDAWGTPIHFVPQGWVMGTLPSGTPQFVAAPATPASRTFVRSSGPDRSSNFKTATEAVNNDDIYSYEP